MCTAFRFSIWSTHSPQADRPWTGVDGLYSRIECTTKTTQSPKAIVKYATQSLGEKKTTANIFCIHIHCVCVLWTLSVRSDLCPKTTDTQQKRKSRQIATHAPTDERPHCNHTRHRYAAVIFTGIPADRGRFPAARALSQRQKKRGKRQ